MILLLDILFGLASIVIRELLSALALGLSTRQVDHDNHIRDDNRAVNLKDTTFLQNMRNRGAISSTITGHQGIWYCKRRNRYVAEITMNRKKVWQRTFKTATQAATERAEKLIELGFHENHGLETKGK